jgi:hypothetical protein
MQAVGQAACILEHGNRVCCELDDIDPAVERRMIRALRATGDEMSLPEYAEVVNDVCIFAISAMEKGSDKVAHSNAAADRELRRLIAATVEVWKEETGCSLPDVPSSTSFKRIGWRDLRKLEQPPIWILCNALGIILDGHDVRRLSKLRGLRFAPNASTEDCASSVLSSA